MTAAWPDSLSITMVDSVEYVVGSCGGVSSIEVLYGTISMGHMRLAPSYNATANTSLDREECVCCVAAAAEKSYAKVQFYYYYIHYTSRGGWAAVWLPKLLLTPSSRFFPTSTKQELQTRLIFGEKKCSMRGGGRPNSHHSSLSTPGFYV